MPSKKLIKRLKKLKTYYKGMYDRTSHISEFKEYYRGKFDLASELLNFLDISNTLEGEENE